MLLVRSPRHLSSPQLHHARRRRSVALNWKCVSMAPGSRTPRKLFFTVQAIKCTKIDDRQTTRKSARSRSRRTAVSANTSFAFAPAGGVSELRTFWVGAFTELDEIEPNNESPKPQPVPLNTTVHWRRRRRRHRFLPGRRAKKGERVSAEIEAIRLGRAHARQLSRDQGQQRQSARLGR